MILSFRSIDEQPLGKLSFLKGQFWAIVGHTIWTSFSLWININVLLM